MSRGMGRTIAHHRLFSSGHAGRIADLTYFMDCEKTVVPEVKDGGEAALILHPLLAASAAACSNSSLQPFGDLVSQHIEEALRPMSPTWDRPKMSKIGVGSIKTGCAASDLPPEGSKKERWPTGNSEPRFDRS